MEKIDYMTSANKKILLGYDSRMDYRDLLLLALLQRRHELIHDVLERKGVFTKEDLLAIEEWYLKSYNKLILYFKIKLSGISWDKFLSVAYEVDDSEITFGDKINILVMLPELFSKLSEREIEVLQASDLIKEALVLREQNDMRPQQKSFSYDDFMLLANEHFGALDNSEKPKFGGK